MSEGKSASWRSRVCEARAARTEGKSVSWRSRVCEARAAHTEGKSASFNFFKNDCKITKKSNTFALSN